LALLRVPFKKSGQVFLRTLAGMSPRSAASFCRLHAPRSGGLDSYTNAGFEQASVESLGYLIVGVAPAAAVSICPSAGSTLMPGDGGGDGPVLQDAAPDPSDAESQADASCSILASNYDQSCSFDRDCVAVAEGDLCAAQLCWCPSNAINQSALAQYQDDVGARALNVCDCALLGLLTCVDGVCRISKSSAVIDPPISTSTGAK